MASLLAALALAFLVSFGTTQGTLGLGLALYSGGSLLMGNQKTPTIDAPKVEGAFEGGYNCRRIRPRYTWRTDLHDLRVDASGQLILGACGLVRSAANRHNIWGCCWLPVKAR